MIELLQEYWRPFLYSDGQHITGLAMTMWLLSASLVIGFLVSIPLSIARVSRNPLVRWPVQFYTYLFRGTPLYIQLLICYTGIYSIAAVRARFTELHHVLQRDTARLATDAIAQVLSR